MSGPAGYETDFEKTMKEKGFVIREDKATMGINASVIESLKELSEDNPVSVDESELEELKLPPFPVPFRDYDADETSLRYSGPDSDYGARIMHKILYLWILWAQLRTSPALEKLLSTKADDEESDEHKAKGCIVDIIDRLAKVLSDTDLSDEMRFLIRNSNDLQTKVQLP